MRNYHGRSRLDVRPTDCSTMATVCLAGLLACTEVTQQVCVQLSIVSKIDVSFVWQPRSILVTSSRKTGPVEFKCHRDYPMASRSMTSVESLTTLL